MDAHPSFRLRTAAAGSPGSRGHAVRPVPVSGTPSLSMCCALCACMPCGMCAEAVAVTEILMV